MLYQKLLVGANPYFVSVGPASAFEVHRHPEIELSYCMKGSFNIIIGKKEYILNEGDLAVVNPMAAHELGEKHTEDCLRLTVDVGPGLLGEQFDLFVSMNHNSILSLKDDGADKLYKELAELLDQTADVFDKRPPFYSLTVKGNVYKISATLLQILVKGNVQDSTLKTLTDIEKIDRAISIIYNQYDEPLDLDSVSALCGYSKSNFCKVFKAITGETFHSMLNRHRVDIACLKLKDSNASVEDIALSVGFTDTKSFCRVFKTITGESSGNYKRRHKKQ